VVIEVFAGASSEVVPLREVEVGGQGAGEEQRRLQECRKVGHRVDVHVVTPALELLEEPAGVRRPPRDREPVDAPAAQHVHQLFRTPRCAEYKRREEVDRALPDRCGVVRHQLTEPGLAERLDRGVEPQSVLGQPAVDELERGVQRVVVRLLEVELESPVVLAERIHQLREAQQPLPGVPRRVLERVVTEHQLPERIDAQVALAPPQA
jgi:hypothetical protein